MNPGSSQVAGCVAEWKGIAARRLEVLDEEIAQLQHAREVLAAALMCRYDHPASDCKIMGAEIDRRLGHGVDVALSTRAAPGRS